MKKDENDVSIYIYIYIQLIDMTWWHDTNHVRLQSYLRLYVVYKTFNITEYYYICTKLFFF